MRANPADLHGMVPAEEALGRRPALDRAFDVRVVELSSGAAGSAQQELPRTRMAGTRAADEGVQRRQPVHQPLGEQELKRAIDCGRSRRVALALAGKLVPVRRDAFGSDRMATCRPPRRKS